jgi:small subunit ribosomal protein S20
MANTAQARKRARQNDKQRAHNAAQRTSYRTAVKKVRKAVLVGDKAAAQNLFNEAQGMIDRIADKGLFHKNKAARDKSRLAAAVKAMA